MVEQDFDDRDGVVMGMIGERFGGASRCHCEENNFRIGKFFVFAQPDAKMRPMKLQSTHVALVLGLFVVPACSNKDDAKDAPPPPPPPSATATAAAPVVADPPATAKPQTALVPESGVAGVAARVKGEVDGKEPDAGDRGAAMVAGKATFVGPKDWTAGKSGVWTTATSADKKAAVTAGTFGASEAATAKLPEAAAALGYSDCTWAPAETVSVGKDKLAGVAADGTCKQGGASVKVAYVAFDSMKVLALGGWADGGDATGVFSTFRHVKGVAGGGAPDGIKACCAALSQNANSAPLDQKGAYLQAAAICNGLASNPQARALLGQVRSALKGANVPASCL